eukprot:CAMPEP_0175122804 /NCGR_PEP_ID=MMETSP0087-20121206/1908_1 /TAXON_ID=136419 /ORGANISM="Unknown Unknown, Strain D1" /LENGTH=220 /DNA_ID=CAMNT_0016404459 /DNA_START=35 /DNA_END=693 /DNA_ORIENTATION=+
MGCCSSTQALKPPEEVEVPLVKDSLTCECGVDFESSTDTFCSECGKANPACIQEPPGSAKRKKAEEGAATSAVGLQFQEDMKVVNVVLEACLKQDVSGESMLDQLFAATEAMDAAPSTGATVADTEAVDATRATGTTVAAPAATKTATLAKDGKAKDFTPTSVKTKPHRILAGNKVVKKSRQDDAAHAASSSASDPAAQKAPDALLEKTGALESSSSSSS